MYKVSIFLLAAILSLFSPNVTSAQDERSTPIINSLNAKLKGAKAIKANFTTLYNDSKGKTKTTIKGNFTFKDEKYIIDMGTQKIYNNGINVYTYLVNASEVQISKYNPNKDAISPASLFSGNFVQDYDYKYLSEKTIGGRKVHQIMLKPKKPSNAYTRMELFIDAQTSEISGGNVFEKNGNFYSISITGLNMNAKVNDKDFTLDTKQLQGVEVIQL